MQQQDEAEAALSEGEEAAAPSAVATAARTHRVSMELDCMREFSGTGSVCQADCREQCRA